MTGFAHQGFSLEWEQILIWISLPTVCCQPFFSEFLGGFVLFPLYKWLVHVCVVHLWFCSAGGEVRALLLPVDRKGAQHSRAETVVLPKLLQFRGFVVINISPQLAEKLYPKPSFESLCGLWRSKEVGSSILLWCKNKENFSYYCYHCFHPYYLRTWFAVGVVIFPIPELWQIFDTCLFLMVRGDRLVDMVFVYQKWCSCILACVHCVWDCSPYIVNVTAA